MANELKADALYHSAHAVAFALLLGVCLSNNIIIISDGAYCLSEYSETTEKKKFGTQGHLNLQNGTLALRKFQMQRKCDFIIYWTLV